MSELTITAGQPTWIDLVSSDMKGAEAFYGELFGWTVEDMGEEYGGYRNFALDGKIVAGGMAKTPEMGEMPDVWSVYLRSDDIEATCKAVEANGGQVVLPPHQVPDVGRFAVTVDPGGAAIGVWEADPFPGLEVQRTNGSPTWFETYTRDFDTVVDYYTRVFGWTVERAPADSGMTYATLGEQPDARAGIMDMTGVFPDEVPPHWAVYFGTADIDASVAKVQELGGRLTDGPEDTPWGRMATVTDPTGTIFKLHEPRPAG